MQSSRILRHSQIALTDSQITLRLTGSCWYTITHQVTQTILKPIYKSPSASRRLLKFFKSISWITSSLAGASSVSRKQDFCKYLQKPNWRMDRAPCHATSCGRWRVSSALRFLLPDCQGQRTFMCSAMTVARPVGVIPTTRTPSQRKCSRHASRRGSNNTTSSPVCGSTLTKRAPFLSEHETQASARFSEVDCPPATTGTTWSTWKVASWPV
jgi:hypothetical protein